jgi:hypothetical protein
MGSASGNKKCMKDIGGKPRISVQFVDGDERITLKWKWVVLNKHVISGSHGHKHKDDNRLVYSAV